MRSFLTLLFGVAALALGEPATLVATTSLLECAVRDYGAALPADLEIVRLVPPGTCPGHFDLSPRMVPLLRRARLVVRHDFQEVLDGQLRKLGGPELRVQAVPAKGSLLVPAHYTALSAAMADILAELWPERGDALRARHREIAEEVARLGTEAQAKARPWRETPLLASAMQREFCAWLGLAVVAVLPRPDDTSPRKLAELLRSDARWIAGNLQSDAKAAEALGRRKGVPVAVLSNFPLREGDGYRGLLAANLAALEDAWRQR